MSNNKNKVCDFPDNKMGLGGKQEVEYVCPLVESDQKKALEELREDANIREQSLDQMRDWIEKHPNIKKCRTGELYRKMQFKELSRHIGNVNQFPVYGDLQNYSRINYSTYVHSGVAR